MRRSLFTRVYKKSTDQQYESATQQSESEFNIPIGLTLKENVEIIKKKLGDPSDLIVRDITVGKNKHKCSILYLSGLADQKLVNDNILKMVQTEISQSDTNSNQSGTGQSEPNANPSEASQSEPNANPSEASQSEPNANPSGTGQSEPNANPSEANKNNPKSSQSGGTQSDPNLLETIEQHVIAITDTKKGQTLYEVINAILSGNAVFLLDGVNTVLVMGTTGYETRSIEEPQSEAVVRGPRTGFIENIDKNITLIRRELKDPNLRFDVHEVGRRSKQKVVVCSIAGIVNPDILNEVNRRIKTIDIDAAPDSGFVEQWIEDSFLSPIPQILDTERPDHVTYSVLQGKVAILVDGSPFALIAPVMLGEPLQSIEDYSQRWAIGTLLRLLRFLSIFISLFLPAIYVALTSYHPGMLPTKLAFSIAATREGVPFPSIFEALLMAVTFEILQEAGIRLPKAIGSTIGIVGGIVIGDVAVSAGIVSPAMVIITSLTAIASFTTPNYSLATGLRVLRFGLLAAASILGLYGIILVFIMMCIHIVNLKSMGVPFSSPIAPYFLGNLKNLLIRSPIITLKKRPPYLEPRDINKINDGGKSK
ncbi:spore germination protein [Lysinibacillus composti]|uniref:Spore germination protein n=1 Tax=Lysinibacillus composti TaxID=720633 RepID=A0A3N9US76_9BACI|nr:spore germination protein [Lysinibacillus composti]MBM7608439.1 spore germination protein [Lysinibacillus composti]RQW74736.1 spore germination protein [Lysinibacillus composti]